MISEKTLIEQSAFFANLSSCVYKDLAFMRVNFEGFKVVYHGHKGADAFTLEDDNNFIVACRGTEVKQFSDVKADLSISKTTVAHGKLHIGFNHYVDKVWRPIMALAQHTQKKVWFTGHSLGAAMATIMAYRFATDDTLPTPAGLFTYGSPRVGNRTFINYFNTLPFPHHRWVNDGDIVTKIPFAPWFYHCGTMHHIDESGYVTPFYEKASLGYRIMRVIKSRGVFRMLWQDTQDHSSELYRNYLALAEKFPIMENSTL